MSWYPGFREEGRKTLVVTQSPLGSWLWLLGDAHLGLQGQCKQPGQWLNALSHCANREQECFCAMFKAWEGVTENIASADREMVMRDHSVSVAKLSSDSSSVAGYQE